MRKYKNKKTPRMVNGKQYMFDSKAEALRYDELRILLKYKKITELRIQPEFEITNKFTVKTDKTQSGKSKSGAVKYIADFWYKDGDGLNVVEDVKGAETTSYKIKKKLFLVVAKHYDVDKFIEVKNTGNITYYPKSIEALSVDPLIRHIGQSELKELECHIKSRYNA